MMTLVLMPHQDDDSRLVQAHMHAAHTRGTATACAKSEVTDLYHTKMFQHTQDMRYCKASSKCHCTVYPDRGAIGSGIVRPSGQLIYTSRSHLPFAQAWILERSATTTATTRATKAFLFCFSNGKFPDPLTSAAKQAPK
mmetsp:Transcript_3779/g.6281  ORF Transcript_3779/g.6281 Transcript_3779/m.6281 type:complete len:139 (+) Transcript_3779:413-829(+)